MRPLGEHVLVITRTDDVTPPFCVQTALEAREAAAEKLKNRLMTGIAHFAFVKENGEIREAYGTLYEPLLPRREEPADSEKKDKKPANPENVTYFDVLPF